MQLEHITATSKRHADTFSSGAIVFAMKLGSNRVLVQVETNTSKSGIQHKTFAILLNEERVTATSNYPKAIGLAMLEITECKQSNLNN